MEIKVLQFSNNQQIRLYSCFEYSSYINREKVDKVTYIVISLPVIQKSS